MKNATNMSTEQATQRLAMYWQIGGVSDAAMAIERCKEASRKWDWEAANQAMREAYQLLGAEAPVVSLVSIHRGEHPVQVKASA